MSEQTVGRIRKDGGWDRRFRRTPQAVPQGEPETRMPLVRLLNLAFSMLALELMVLAWALSLVMR